MIIQIVSHHLSRSVYTVSFFSIFPHLSIVMTWRKGTVCFSYWKVPRERRCVSQRVSNNREYFSWVEFFIWEWENALLFHSCFSSLAPTLDTNWFSAWKGTKETILSKSAWYYGVQWLLYLYLFPLAHEGSILSCLLIRVLCSQRWTELSLLKWGVYSKREEVESASKCNNPLFLIRAFN